MKFTWSCDRIHRTGNDLLWNTSVWNSLFPQPVTCIENVDIEGVAEFFDEVIKKNETPQKDPTSSGPKHYHNDANVLEMYSELHPLRDRIVEAASFAYRDVMNFSDGVRLTNAWFNECPKTTAEDT